MTAMLKIASIITITTALFLGGFMSNPVIAADTYTCFADLAAVQTEGVDFRIECQDRSTATVLIAIHGGLIEKGASEVVKAVSDQTGCSYYTFLGIKSSNNSVLHITSSNFDEPIARALVNKSQCTVSIHGAAGAEPVTYIGGLDRETSANIMQNLVTAGFNVRIAPDNMGGTNCSNIANDNTAGKGVQLELSKAQRDDFFTNGQTNDTFDEYVQALSTALE